MKLTTKLLFIAIVSVGSLILIVSLSLIVMRQVSDLRETREEGLELLLQSRTVHGVLENLMFDLFAPQTYTLLKDVIHTPRAAATIRSFRDESNRFRTALERFMSSPDVRSLLGNGWLRDEYETTRVLSRKAFDHIDAVLAGLETLQASGAIGTEGLYARIQSGGEPELFHFFRDVRSASYYFTYSFDGFLELFVRSLNEEALAIQERALLAFWLFTVFVGSLTITVILLFAARTTSRIRRLESSVRTVAGGDFTVSLPSAAQDELGALARSFNDFVRDLEANVDSVLRLTRDVDSALQRHSDLGSILSMVVEATVNDTRAEAAAVVRRDGAELRIEAATRCFPETLHDSFRRDIEETLAAGGIGHRSDGIDRTGNEPARGDGSGSDRGAGVPTSWTVVPLHVGERRLGALCAITLAPDIRLNRFDHTFLSTFADYAALIIEHHAYYQELLEKREAEYQALQSQIQPHFLYNVLGTIIGLNRVGDGRGLENAVLSLRSLLRYTLEPRHWVRLSEELDMITGYCKLQELRFGERLSYRIECDERVRDWKIPKLLIQPLVENAVVHGIEPCERHGTVSVAASVSEHDTSSLVITVQDDGVGFDPEAVAESQRVGLANVRKRIGLLYPDGSLALSASPGAGATATFTLPEAAVRESVHASPAGDALSRIPALGGRL